MISIPKLLRILYHFGSASATRSKHEREHCCPYLLKKWAFLAPNRNSSSEPLTPSAPFFSQLLEGNVVVVNLLFLHTTFTCHLFIFQTCKGIKDGRKKRNIPIDLNSISWGGVSTNILWNERFPEPVEIVEKSRRLKDTMDSPSGIC